MSLSLKKGAFTPNNFNFGASRPLEELGLLLVRLRCNLFVFVKENDHSVCMCM